MSTSHAAGITNFHTIPYEITQLLILIVQNGDIIQNYLQHLQFTRTRKRAVYELQPSAGERYKPHLLP